MAIGLYPEANLSRISARRDDEIEFQLPLLPVIDQIYSLLYF
jgi:hypothetical protein